MPNCVHLWANVNEDVARARDLPTALAYADHAMQKRQTVVVHCVRGRHRAGAFCTWLWALTLVSAG